MNVPTSTSSHDTKISIVKNHYNSNNFLSSFFSKHSSDNNNGLFLTTRPILKMLIGIEGLKIGSSSYRIKPQTTVFRCFHCQQLGHLSRFCSNSFHCANCGLDHADNNYSNLSNCINCAVSNSIYTKPVITRHINPPILITLVIHFAYVNKRSYLDNGFFKSINIQNSNQLKNTAHEDGTFIEHRFFTSSSFIPNSQPSLLLFMTYNNQI